MNTSNILNQRYHRKLGSLKELRTIKLLLKQLDKMEINQDAWITKLIV